MNYSYIAVLASDNFFPGLCALSYSLKKVNAKYPLSVVVHARVSQDIKNRISNMGIALIEMNDIVVDDTILSSNLEKRWNRTLFKLNIFNITKFEKIVFLDLDMIIMHNIDALFSCPHMSAVAAGHCKIKEWTSLNSGLMVIEPNEDDYNGLIKCCTDALEECLQNGRGFGDQDVIKYYYQNWDNQLELQLSEAYNCLPMCIDVLSAQYSFDHIKVVHFCDHTKPWQYRWWDHVLFLGKRIAKCEWNRIRALYIYQKYIKQSCPDYKNFR